MNLNLMQRVFYSFALFFLICWFAACKKNSDNPQVLIVGKWNLQRYHIAEYDSGTKSYDTTYVSPSTLPFPNYTQFNSDGSFMNVQRDVSSLDTTRGNYGLTGTAITFSNFQSHAAIGVVLTPIPLYFVGGGSSDLSGAARIDQINSHSLTIHAEVTPVTTSVNYKFVIDQYYTR
jgi:hypothetical protein